MLQSWVLRSLSFARATFLSEGVKTFDGAAPWTRQMRESDANNLTAVLGYLEIFKDRFWLVAVTALMQVHDLHTAKGDTKPG